MMTERDMESREVWGHVYTLRCPSTVSRSHEDSKTLDEFINVKFTYPSLSF